MAFAMPTPPGGWLECAGQLLTRTTYPDLFAAIGTIFNVGGEAVTDFRLPDLRGSFQRGWDNGRSLDAGRTFGTTQQDALQNITGTWYSFPNTAAVGPFGAAGAITGSTAPTAGTPSGTPSGAAVQFNFNASNVARTASETRPHNVALLFCIKAFGVAANQGVIDITSLSADVAEVRTSGFTKSYTSPEQTITAAGSLTLAHGLGVQPRLLQAVLVCKTAELNYSVNEEVVINLGAIQEWNSGQNSVGVGVALSTTNLNCRYGSNAVFYILNKTTGIVTGITPANWRLKIKAWA